MEQNKVVLFQEKNIRRVWHEEKWWFVIEDVVSVLTESSNPKQYIKDIRRRDLELSKRWVQIATILAVETEGGKQRMNCAHTEGLLRLIMSIPSPRAEPFKLWLAQVGQERIAEIENPETALKGGTAAGEARKRLEQVTGKPVVSNTNFLNGFIEEEKPLLDEK